MTLYQKWVDPVTGNNANPGTEADPYATVRYACESGNGAGAWVGADTLIINVVPSGSLQSDDHLRFDNDWDGARCAIRSAVEGVPFVADDDTNVWIYMIQDTRVKLEINDALVVCNRIQYFAGTTASGGPHIDVTYGSSCQFTHSRTDAENGIEIDSDATGSRLTIEDGCTIFGWSSPFYCPAGALAYCRIGKARVNGGLCDGDGAYLAADEMRLNGMEYNMPRSVANSLLLRNNSGTTFKITDCAFYMHSTATAGAFVIDAPAPGGSTTNKLEVLGNEFSGDCPGPLVVVGGIVDSASSRATNDATRVQFAAGSRFDDNDIINTNDAGGALWAHVGTSNVEGVGNYMRRGVLGESTNVHSVYLYGDGIKLRHCMIQGQVLMFGPNQSVSDCVIAGKIAILLGGTQGGGTTVGGGNAYRTTNNVLIAAKDSCLNDYAYNGAYGSGSNLGVLVARVDGNVYVPLAGASGASRLLESGLYANTIEEIRNLWGGSALTGIGSVWGDPVNADNDAHSRVALGSELQWYQDLIDSAGGVLQRKDFERIIAGPPAAIVATINADPVHAILAESTTAIQKLVEADRLLINEGGVRKLQTRERGTATDLIPAKTAKQPDGTDLTDPDTQRLAGYQEPA